jgi:hypothetical protein
MQFLFGVWCGGDGVCLGVGDTPQEGGAVVVLRANGQIGPVQPVPDAFVLYDIECAPGGGCIAVGRGLGGGVVVEVTRAGTPGPVRPVPGTTELFDVACPTPTTCLATGHLRQWPPTLSYPVSTPLYVVINDGQPTLVRDMPRGTGRAIGIDCPTATTCLAIGSSGAVVLTNADGNWTASLRRSSNASGTGHPTDAISCGSATTCFATAAAFIQRPDGYLGVPGMVPVSSDGVVGPVQALADQSGNSYDISCAYWRSCTVVGSLNLGGGGLIVDVFRGTPTLTRWPGYQFLGVSCVGPSSCGVVGASGAGPVFLWHGSVPP